MQMRNTLGLGLAVFALWSGAALATSYVPMRDAALLAQAPQVVTGTVRAVNDRAPRGRAETEYTLQVGDRLKGALGLANTIKVYVPGGYDQAGYGMVISGAPHFRVGEQVLLFLGDSHGAYGISQFLLGAFHLVDGPNGPLAVRDLDGAEARGAAVEPAGKLRDAGRFSAWIRAGGAVAATSYFTDDQPLAATPKYHLITGPDQRWFTFDSGGVVTWKADDTPDPDVPGGGYITFQTALYHWNGDATSRIQLSYAGTANNTNGLTAYDGQNFILFNDPNNEIPGSYDCNNGGVLAMGGPWFSGSTSTYNGVSYNRILSGDVVVQDGVGCFLAENNGVAGVETITHEVGHTLGLNHSCGDPESGDCTAGDEQDQALMRAYAHADWRGGAPGYDEQDAVNFLYGQPRRASMIAIPDVNGDGVSDLAVLTQSTGGAVKVTIVDPATHPAATVLNTIAFGSTYNAVGIAGLVDADGNGKPEVAVLGVARATGAITVDVRDAATDALIKSITGWDSSYTPLAIEAINNDQSGNGKPEVSILGTRASDGVVRLQTRDAITGAFVSNVNFSKIYRPLGMLHVPDSDADGSEEIAVLGSRQDVGNLLVEVREVKASEAGAITGQPRCSAGRRPEVFRSGAAANGALVLMGDVYGGSAFEVGCMAYDGASGSLRLQVMDLTNYLVTTIGYTASYHDALYTSTIFTDMNANGKPEIAYLGRDDTTAQVRGEIHDGASGALIKAVPFGNLYYPEGFANVQDTNGNAQPELVMLGRKLTDDSLQVLVRDASTGTLLANVGVTR
jgi:hypothetical protein